MKSFFQKLAIWLTIPLFCTSLAWAVPAPIAANIFFQAFFAAGGSAAVNLATRFGWILTPMDFNAGAGSGSDDSAALNAWVAAVSANGVGRGFLPPPPSGHYNICASAVNLPGQTNALDLGGPAAGGASIRVLPGCANPPATVINQPLTATPYSSSRVHLHDMTLDGYGLATYDLYIGYAVGFSADHVVFRNVKTGGVNIEIVGGYEISIGDTNRMENINDPGHVLYTSASALPNYNLETSGGDSYFDRLIGIGAYIANFHVSGGGDNHFVGAHGWGYTAGSTSAYDLRSQWTFICDGGCNLLDWISDSPTIGGVQLNAGASNGRTSVIGGQIMGVASANTGFVGVQMASGFVNGRVIANDLTSVPTAANAVLQLGTPNTSTQVFSNLGASYATSNFSLIPSSYGFGLAFSGGQLSWSPPSALAINAINATGGVTAINTIAPYYSLPNGDFPTITIAPPPTGGTQATAVVAQMILAVQGTILPGSTGFVTGDHVCLTTTGGSECYAVVASGGVVTSLGTYLTGGIFTVLPNDVTSVNWVATTGSGTGLKTHGLQWTFAGNSYFAITASGGGYTSAPAATFAPPSDGSLVGGPQTTTTVTNSVLALTGGGGSINLANNQTQLGTAGTAGSPVIGLGAAIDGSGVRQSLSSSYTVPANTSLVRFTQSSTVASSTVTLPTALADGQAIQFDNYAGAVTALTFSPAVTGFTNGSTFAANTGLRIRWDSSGAAWHREQ